MKKITKPLHISLILILILQLLVSAVSGQSARNLKEELEKIPGVMVFTMFSDPMFSEYYEIFFTQPVDHNNPDGEKFSQRVLLGHVGFDRPTVAVIEGYSIYTDQPSEITKFLNANQITIEHRFFADSRPDSIPWNYLTIKQAAADQHEIISALKKIYDKKWLSTGISKGGQATIYHRRFYPNDVDVSVPYVAPLNFSNEDERYYSFLKTVGTPECRKRIYDYQLILFQNKAKLMPMVKQMAKTRNYNFSMGIERAFDLSVLEYSFSFWQWCGSCAIIPDRTAILEEVFQHYMFVNPIGFFENSDIRNNLPFYYQALTEIGMYGYEIKPFKKYLKDTTNITFEFNLPEGTENATFNYEAMKDINNWIQTEGNYMLYIYGQNDAYFATAVEPSKNTNAVRMVNPKGCHTTRIETFPENMKKEIYKILQEWMSEEQKKVNQGVGGSKEEIFEIF
ncbi:MAG: S28 family serine protease [Bacteroidales bacterium]